MLARRAMMRRPVANVGRAVVGTAVVAGTAGAVRHQQNKRWARQDAAAQQQYEQAYQQGAADAQAQQQYAPPPEQYAPAPEEDMITQLERLGSLKAQGILTEEEFAAQKAKLLGM
jgi:outer membrane murein-binding lipoprotein Lpp